MKTLLSFGDDREAALFHLSNLAAPWVGQQDRHQAGDRHEHWDRKQQSKIQRSILLSGNLSDLASKEIAANDAQSDDYHIEHAFCACPHILTAQLPYDHECDEEETSEADAVKRQCGNYGSWVLYVCK